MNLKNLNPTLIFNSITILLSLIIAIDFTLPGAIVSEQIEAIKKERQQYYNAAQNHHFSYKVITATNNFFVSSDFAQLNGKNTAIKYEVSPLFKEVNWYKSDTSRTFQYSLRLYSGLLIPIALLLALLISFKTTYNIDILIFIFRILLFGDFIFVLV